MSSTNRFKKELFRKALHLPVLAFPLMARLNFQATLQFLIFVMLAYILISLLKFKANVRVFILTDVIEFCSRKDVFDPAPLLMALGILGSLCLTRGEVSFLPAATLAVCDSAAALVGLRFGRHYIGGLPKTWEGSSAFFITCLILLLFTISPLSAFGGALLLTILELLSVRGFDNLILPITTQVLLNALT